jgi:hypothetical protein
MAPPKVEKLEPRPPSSPPPGELLSRRVKVMDPKAKKKAEPKKEVDKTEPVKSLKETYVPQVGLLRRPMPPEIKAHWNKKMAEKAQRMAASAATSAASSSSSPPSPPKDDSRRLPAPASPPPSQGSSSDSITHAGKDSSEGGGQEVLVRNFHDELTDLDWTIQQVELIKQQKSNEMEVEAWFSGTSEADPISSPEPLTEQELDEILAMDPPP